MNEELKEWLGIKPADFVIYVAAGAVVWMYFSQSKVLDLGLSVIIVVLCVVSCFLGRRSEACLSKTTNLLKRIAYPVCLIAALICIYLNFTSWNLH